MMDKKGIDCGEDYRLQFKEKHLSSDVLKKIKDCNTEPKSGK